MVSKTHTTCKCDILTVVVVERDVAVLVELGAIVRVRGRDWEEVVICGCVVECVGHSRFPKPHVTLCSQVGSRYNGIV